MAHSGLVSDTRAQAVLRESNSGVTGQLFRIINRLYAVGSDEQFGRDNRAGTRH